MKKNNILRFSRFICFIFVILSFLWLFLMIYHFIQEKSTLGIIFSIVFLIHILLATIFGNIKLIVLEDCFKYTFLFRTKTFKFDDYIIEEDVSCIRVFDLNRVEKKRISYLWDKDNLIYKTYSKYCDGHETKVIGTNSILKYNFYVRNFAIFWLLFGFICCIGAGVMLYQQLAKIIDEIVMLSILSSIGLILFLYGLLELIKYKNFKILLYDNHIEYVNIFHYKRKISYRDIQMISTDYFIKIRFKNRFLILKCYYFLDNADYIIDQIEKKRRALGIKRRV